MNTVTLRDPKSEAEIIVNAVETAMPKIVEKAWALHPNNPKNWVKSHQEAFDLSREVNRPLVLNVGGELGKYFSSGRYEFKFRVQDAPRK